LHFGFSLYRLNLGWIPYCALLCFATLDAIGFMGALARAEAI
jgi:hypothetical protein